MDAQMQNALMIPSNTPLKVIHRLNPLPVGGKASSNPTAGDQSIFVAKLIQE
jgi:hypothetical protein